MPPVVRADQQRDGGNGPGAFIRLADDPKAGADIGGVTLDAFARVGQIVAGDAGEFAEHRGPGGVVAQHVAGHHIAMTATSAAVARAIIGDPAFRMHGRVEQRCWLGGHERGRLSPNWSRGCAFFTLTQGGATGKAGDVAIAL
jgi:hypothetical protein